MATANVGVDNANNSKKSSKANKNVNVAITSAESFTLPVLQIIREAQQQHGLRHGDYQRYRQYCARRLHRVRTTLHCPMGTKHKVIPRNWTIESLTDLRMLFLPLIDAERCWAYAMQLKVEANTERRKKFHMLRKLRKAVFWAKTLSELCQHEKYDARTKLETQAYYAWMQGTFFFETEEWKQSIEQFSSAKTIYEKLAGAVVDDSREVYQLKCDEIVPSIRYCSYSIGDKSAINDLMQMRVKAGAGDDMTSKLDELIEMTRLKQAAMLSEVTWRGRTVPVKNEHARLLLLNINGYEQQISGTESIDGQLSIYEKMAKDLVDVQQLLKEDYKDDPNFKAGLKASSGEEKISNSVYLYTYVSYLRLVKTAERNLVMAESFRTSQDGGRAPESNEKKKSMKPQDYARLYDIVMQNLSEIQQLPSIADDENMMAEIRAHLSYCKTLRCYYIAQGYVIAKRWKEAIALLERVLQYGKLTLESINNKVNLTMVSQTVGKIVKNATSLDQLLKTAEGQKFTCLASSIIDLDSTADGIPKSTAKSDKPLIDRLDEYFEDPSIASSKGAINLVQFPPDFVPVPCKPLFFDVAMSHVQFPNLDDKIEKKKEGGGITNFVKGWFWGSKK